MSQVVCDISISVDGYAASPNQTLEKPFGDGPVDELHAWMFETPEENEAEVSAILVEQVSARQASLVTHLVYRTRVSAPPEGGIAR